MPGDVQQLCYGRAPSLLDAQLGLRCRCRCRRQVRQYRRLQSRRHLLQCLLPVVVQLPYRQSRAIEEVWVRLASDVGNVFMMGFYDQEKWD